MVHYDKSMFCVQSLEEEEKMTPEQLAIKNVGKQVHIAVYGRPME